MNRRSRQPTVLVGDESSKALRISRLLRTGDSVDGARVAELHGLLEHDRWDHSTGSVSPRPSQEAADVGEAADVFDHVEAEPTPSCGEVLHFIV